MLAIAPTSWTSACPLLGFFVGNGEGCCWALGPKVPLLFTTERMLRTRDIFAELPCVHPPAGLPPANAAT